MSLKKFQIFYFTHNYLFHCCTYIALFLYFNETAKHKKTSDALPQMKNHYRGHKLSMWLSLIPQIHSPGESPDLSMRHHHFSEENPQFYDGKILI